MDIMNATWEELLVSFLLTWTIGLTPPLLLRYVIVRRPFRKWGAIATVSGFWVLEFLLALVLDEVNGRTGPHNHPALMLVALASYYILMRPSKPLPGSTEGFSQ